MARKSSLLGRSSLRISGSLDARTRRDEKFAEFDSPLMYEGLAPPPVQKIGTLCSINSFEKTAIPAIPTAFPLRILESKSAKPSKSIEV
jgi:hypothetical protein